MLELLATYAAKAAVSTLAALSTKAFFSKVKNEVEAIHAAREARREKRNAEDTASKTPGSDK